MEDIKSKIKKLLSLATSSNEAEAMSAMTKAQALMNEYRISNLDLELSGTDNEMDMSLIQGLGNFDHKWKGLLAQTIAEANYCMTIKFANVGTKIVGRKENILVANAMFEYVLSFIKSKKLGSADLKNYGLGFWLGLKSKLEEGKSAWVNQTPHAGELVVVYNTEITNHLQTIGIKTKSAPVKSGISRKGDMDYYENGIKDGKNFNLSKQMTSNAKELEQKYEYGMSHINDHHYSY